MYFEEGLEQVKNLLNSIDKKYRNVVMWGVGKYASNILMNTQIINRINYFVDSTNYGNTYYGKNVLSPNSVDWKDIDVIVVAAYFAADDIIDIIRQIPNFSGEIVDASKVETDKPFYEYESIKQFHVKENDEYLCRNVKFRDCGIKKKCYILGSGPSSKNFDLSKLRDETVFVVNDFFRFDNIEEIHPDYYVLADPAYFRQYTERLKRISDMKKINKDISFFVPLKCYKEKKEIVDNLFKRDVYFYSATRDIEKCADSNIDITKELPQIQATIHAAIYIAIYMGYKDIFLIGCEETGVLGCIQMFLTDTNVNIHSYCADEESLSKFREHWQNAGLSSLLRGFSIIFRNYDYINQMCNQNGISLYTCANETLLKNITYCSYEDTFDN